MAFKSSAADIGTNMESETVIKIAVDNSAALKGLDEVLAKYKEVEGITSRGALFEILDMAEDRRKVLEDCWRKARDSGDEKLTNAYNLGEWNLRMVVNLTRKLIGQQS